MFGERYEENVNIQTHIAADLNKGSQFGWIPVFLCNPRLTLRGLSNT